MTYIYIYIYQRASVFSMCCSRVWGFIISLRMLRFRKLRIVLSTYFYRPKGVWGWFLILLLLNPKKLHIWIIKLVLRGTVISTRESVCDLRTFFWNMLQYIRLIKVIRFLLSVLSKSCSIIFALQKGRVNLSYNNEDPLNFSPNQGGYLHRHCYRLTWNWLYKTF